MPKCVSEEQACLVISSIELTIYGREVTQAFEVTSNKWPKEGQICDEKLI